MKLTDEVKQKIIEEFQQWEQIQYAGKDKKERQRLGQFFTSPTLTIMMIEKFDNIEDKDIIDPTCGAGNLLAGMILAGADPKRIFGIELDPAIHQIAVKRLAALGVPEKNILLGNALDENSYKFNK